MPRLTQGLLVVALAVPVAFAAAFAATYGLLAWLA